MTPENKYLNFVKEHFEYEEDDLLEIDGYQRYSSEIDRRRKDLVKEYAWAIPNEEAIELIVGKSPIVEIGAGNGYWANLVDGNGGDIIAFDSYDREYKRSWFEVKKESAEVAGQFPDRSLFICWPEYKDSMGEVAVENYEGDTVILVGEPISGCTGTADMYRMIEDNFELRRTVNIPNWFGIKDRMYLYENSESGTHR